jgi:hypothetical protein
MELDELDQEFDPPRQLELYLGLCLAALRDILDYPEEYEEPDACLMGTLDIADEWLVDWSNKYEEFVTPILGKK